MIRDKRGSYSLEALFNLPVFIMLFFLIFETGFLMYDWAVVNYAASSAAVLACKEGQFSESIRSETAQYLRQWTSNGKDLSYDIYADSPYESQNTVVIWGTDPSLRVQRGGTITVGVVYPVHFKSFIVNAMAKWLVQDNRITLKAGATGSSEVFFEP